MTYLGPVLIGIFFVTAMSLVRDDRRRFDVNVLLAAGASGIYLSGGGFGAWEFIPMVVIFGCAVVALRRRSWSWIGAAWLLHTGSDIAHAAFGIELLPFAPHSALGCAICDPIIALWCFSGGRPLDQMIKLRARVRTGTPSTAGIPGSRAPTR